MKRQGCRHLLSWYIVNLFVARLQTRRRRFKHIFPPLTQAHRRARPLLVCLCWPLAAFHGHETLCLSVASQQLSAVVALGVRILVGLFVLPRWGTDPDRHERLWEKSHLAMESFGRWFGRGLGLCGHTTWWRLKLVLFFSPFSFPPPLSAGKASQTPFTNAEP